MNVIDLTETSDEEDNEENERNITSTSISAKKIDNTNKKKKCQGPIDMYFPSTAKKVENTSKKRCYTGENFTAYRRTVPNKYLDTELHLLFGEDEQNRCQNGASSTSMGNKINNSPKPSKFRSTSRPHVPVSPGFPLGLTEKLGRTSYGVTKQPRQTFQSVDKPCKKLRSTDSTWPTSADERHSVKASSLSKKLKLPQSSVSGTDFDETTTQFKLASSTSGKASVSAVHFITNVINASSTKPAPKYRGSTAPVLKSEIEECVKRGEMTKKIKLSHGERETNGLASKNSTSSSAKTCVRGELGVKPSNGERYINMWRSAAKSPSLSSPSVDQEHLNLKRETALMQSPSMKDKANKIMKKTGTCDSVAPSFLRKKANVISEAIDWKWSSSGGTQYKMMEKFTSAVNCDNINEFCRCRKRTRDEIPPHSIVNTKFTSNLLNSIELGDPHQLISQLKLILTTGQQLPNCFLERLTDTCEGIVKKKIRATSIADKPILNSNVKSWRDDEDYKILTTLSRMLDMLIEAHCANHTTLARWRPSIDMITQAIATADNCLLASTRSSVAIEVQQVLAPFTLKYLEFLLFRYDFLLSARQPNMGTDDNVLKQEIVESVGRSAPNVINKSFLFYVNEVEASPGYMSNSASWLLWVELLRLIGTLLQDIMLSITSKLQLKEELVSTVVLFLSQSMSNTKRNQLVEAVQAAVNCHPRPSDIGKCLTASIYIIRQNRTEK